MVKEKYDSVLKLGETLQIKNGDVKVEGETLHVSGQAATPYIKNILWDEIKKVGGQTPSDIIADITILDDSIYHKHTVVSGDTLGKISKKYYGKSSAYNTIFEANKDILDNPDLIKVGQILTIPNR
ncbi:LysM peptidoglycan-binding domain-containing protein [Wenyingzhuangia sp. 1_MG-2023]|nr:LysM peptidoglycan-binding domain-containing protein [Wenyingzhuangia sp. 1_MG-2023]